MRKRILKIIGGLGFLLGALSGFAKFSKWVIGRLGDIDFLWTQYTAPTWTKDVVDFLEMTPPWLWPIVMFLAVAVLILERRWPRTSTEPHPAPPATQQATKGGYQPEAGAQNALSVQFSKGKYHQDSPNAKDDLKSSRPEVLPQLGYSQRISTRNF